MAYRLTDSQALSHDIRRIALQQIDEALSQVNSRTRNKDRAVHQSRICFKKIRTVLRLVRSEIGASTFKLEDAEYRDAGRRLSGIRDIAVVAQTLESLIRHSSEPFANDTLSSGRRVLSLSRAQQHFDRNDVLTQVTEILESARRRVESWQLKNNNFSGLRAGLLRIYRRGRTTFVMARTLPSTNGLHQWRKDVKYLLYAVCLMNPVWPKMLDVLAAELNRLADYLGEDHDLALLSEICAEQAESFGDHAEIEWLVRLVNQRRFRLQAKATALGERIYSEPPRAFVSRLETYFEVWRFSRISEPGESLPADSASYQAAASLS